MLKIGEFSKIAQVSIKALRHYDQMGLLKPAHIDRFNGYRYYNLSQLLTLNRILALKDLDFSLEQINELLDLDLSDHAMQNMLKHKAAELRQRINDEQARLLRLENRLQAARDAINPNASPVVVKPVPDLLIATIRETLASVDDLAEWQNVQVDKIHQELKRLGCTPAGPDLLIYHQDDYREFDLDVEVGTIIKQARDNTEKREVIDKIHIHTLFGVNQAASMVTSAAQGSLSETYAKLAYWTQINGFRPIGAWRELTYKQAEPSSIQVVEVQRPIMKAIEFYYPLEVNKMEPKIITRSAFTIVGLRYFGKNEHQEISELWGEFNHRSEEIGGIPHETGEAAIGLCTTPEDAGEEGAIEYVAGVPVSKVNQVPEDFVIRQMPEYTYAVFAHKGDLPSLGKTYEYIYETWLPQSGYQLAAPIDFEYYDQDFKDFSPESVFYIYLPIQKA